MSPEEKHELVGAVFASSFSGPLPPPEVLAKYDQIVPGLADRLITMAERQQDHRQHLEKTVVESNARSQKWGLILGFIIAMTAICGGIALVATGKGVAGVTAIIAALASLVGVFVYGKVVQGKELDDKAAAVPPPGEAIQRSRVPPAED